MRPAAWCLQAFKIDQACLGEEFLGPCDGLDHGGNLWLEVVRLIDHVIQFRRATVICHHRREFREKSGIPDRDRWIEEFEVIVRIAAVIEMKASQPTLIQQPGDNLFDVLGTVMVPRVHQYFGLGTRLGRQMQRPCPNLLRQHDRKRVQTACIRSVVSDPVPVPCNIELGSFQMPACGSEHCPDLDNWCHRQTEEITRLPHVWQSQCWPGSDRGLLLNRLIRMAEGSQLVISILKQVWIDTANMDAGIAGCLRDFRGGFSVEKSHKTWTAILDAEPVNA